MPSALILFGILHRSLDHVVDTLRSEIIQPLQEVGEVDLFFHSWDVQKINNPRAGEVGVEISQDQVAHLLPEANGLFESQEEFDGLIDWESMFEHNPMRSCTGSETAARATLMNFRRALESQERAWAFFQRQKTRRYDRIVMTRPDLRFLNRLEIPESLKLESESTANVEDVSDQASEHRVFVPAFHSWRGVNDRFVLGREDEVGIWARRTEFLDGWLLNAGKGNSEWLLMKWLQRNRILTTSLGLIFQRVRANGLIAPPDVELSKGIQHVSAPKGT